MHDEEFKAEAENERQSNAEHHMNISIPSLSKTNKSKLLNMFNNAKKFTTENWKEIAVAVVTIAIVEDLDDLADQ